MSQSSLFPLPFVPFERYMFGDDRNDLPMAFVIRLIYSGRFDPDRFREALRDTLKIHPLLSARAQGDSLMQLRWVEGPDELPTIDDQPSGQPFEFTTGQRIDLRREAGLRVWIRRDDSQGELRFQFHHSCCDGVGAYRFLDDLLARYAALHTPDAPCRAGGVDLALLPQRNDLGLRTVQGWLRMPINLWGLLVGTSLFILRTPREAAFPLRGPLTDDPGRTLIDAPSRSLTPDEFRALAAFAKRRGATLNDLLLNELFILLSAWLHRFGERPTRGFLRIMVPINARTARQDRLPAANVVGMVPIDRYDWIIRRPGFLLRSIIAEMRFLKFFRFGQVFLFIIAALDLLFGGLAKVMDRPRSQATVSFSNVGRVFFDSPLRDAQGKLHAGELIVDRVESYPPIRPHTPISFSSLSYAGLFTLVLNYDRRLIDPATADALLEELVEQLRRLPSSDQGTSPVGGA